MGTKVQIQVQNGDWGFEVLESQVWVTYLPTSVEMSGLYRVTDNGEFLQLEAGPQFPVLHTFTWGVEVEGASEMSELQLERAEWDLANRLMRELEEAADALAYELSGLSV